MRHRGPGALMKIGLEGRESCDAGRSRRHDGQGREDDWTMVEWFVITFCRGAEKRSLAMTGIRLYSWRGGNATVGRQSEVGLFPLLQKFAELIR